MGDGFFFNSGMEVYWWTSTPDLMSPGIATNFGVSNNHREVYATLNTYKVGHYIRCVKD